MEQNRHKSPGTPIPLSIRYVHNYSGGEAVAVSEEKIQLMEEPRILAL
jgi:hypothetical protein